MNISHNSFYGCFALRGAANVSFVLFSLVVILFAGCGKSEPNVNQNAGLIYKLAELKTALNGEMTGEQFAQYAKEIRAEMQANPLPDEHSHPRGTVIRSWAKAVLSDLEVAGEYSRMGELSSAMKLDADNSLEKRRRESCERILNDLRHECEELSDLLSHCVD